MKTLLILGGAVLMGIGILKKSNKSLTEVKKPDTVKPVEAKIVPSDEKTDIDNSSSESGGGDNL